MVIYRLLNTKNCWLKLLHMLKPAPNPADDCFVIVARAVSLVCKGLLNSKVTPVQSGQNHSSNYNDTVTPGMKINSLFVYGMLYTPVHPIIVVHPLHILVHPRVYICAIHPVEKHWSKACYRKLFCIELLELSLVILWLLYIFEKKNCVMIWLICDSLPSTLMFIPVVLAILTKNKRRLSIPKQYILGC